MVRSLINTVPNWLLLVLIVGGTVGVGLLAEMVFRRRRSHGENHEMLTLTFEFVGIAYAILVGFVIVSVWTTQQDALAAVGQEAATLEDMVAVERVIDGSDEGLHDAISAYVDATIEDEFEDTLKQGDHAEGAEDAADGILDAIVAMEPADDIDAALQGEVLGDFSTFQEVRTTRNALANTAIAGEMWVLVLVSSFATVLLIAAFKGQGRWDLAATVIVSTTVGLVLYALVALSYPFSGDVSVEPTPLRGVQHEIERADR
jgi:hypothetical protein